MIIIVIIIYLIIAARLVWHLITIDLLACSTTAHAIIRYIRCVCERVHVSILYIGVCKNFAANGVMCSIEHLWSYLCGILDWTPSIITFPVRM